MSEVSKALKPLPPALPATVDAWQRFIKTRLNLNDEVEKIHLALLNDEELSEQYMSYLYATWDEQAVEGSLSADNVLASNMIREKARAQHNEVVGKEKLATISKALGVCLRRYHQSRKQRRNMVDGEIVPNDHDTDHGD